MNRHDNIAFGSSRVRRIALALLLGGCAAILSGCSSTAPETELWEYPPGAGGTIMLDDSPSGSTYSFDDITLCLTSPGEAHLVNVSAIDPTGGLQVTAFSLLPARDGEVINYLNSPNQKLSEAGFPENSELIVDSVCPDLAESPEDGAVYILGIEVERTDIEAGTARGIRVDYVAGGVALSADFPLSLAVCEELYAPDGSLTPECDVGHI